MNGTWITINGDTVDAAMIIDGLTAKIAELTLENAVLRCQASLYASLAQSHVADAPSSAPEGSESPVRPSPSTVTGSPFADYDPT